MAITVSPNTLKITELNSISSLVNPQTVRGFGKSVLIQYRQTESPVPFWSLALDMKWTFYFNEIYLKISSKEIKIVFIIHNNIAVEFPRKTTIELNLNLKTFQTICKKIFKQSNQSINTSLEVIERHWHKYTKRYMCDKPMKKLWNSIFGIERKDRWKGCPKIKYKTCDKRTVIVKKNKNEGKGLNQNRQQNRDWWVELCQKPVHWAVFNSCLNLWVWKGLDDDWHH